MNETESSLLPGGSLLVGSLRMTEMMDTRPPLSPLSSTLEPPLSRPLFSVRLRQTFLFFAHRTTLSPLNAVRVARKEIGYAMVIETET